MRRYVSSYTICHQYGNVWLELKKTPLFWYAAEFVFARIDSIFMSFNIFPNFSSWFLRNLDKKELKYSIPISYDVAREVYDFRGWSVWW